MPHKGRYDHIEAVQRCCGCYQYFGISEIQNNRCPDCRPIGTVRYRIRSS